MTDRELLQTALDALEYAANETQPEDLYGCNCLICKTIEALRERLAQPEQELMTGNLLKDAYNAMVEKKIHSQRPWARLTNEQIMDCTHHMAKENGVWIVTDNGLLEFAHILEETIRSKNK